MAKLTFHYAAMNAGKSAYLLLSAHNHKEERGLNVDLWSYCTDIIKSRVGISKWCESFKGINFITRYINDVDSWHLVKKIYIDEAQFLTKEQVLELTEMVDNHNIDVGCYGLRTDFKGNLFDGSKYLLAWADDLRHIESVDENGLNALFQIRMNNNQRVWSGNQIDIGHHYNTVSRKSFKLREAQEYVSD